MELKERVEERIRERIRAVVMAAAVLIFAIVAFCFYGLPVLEERSVTEIKAEILGFPLIDGTGRITITTARLKLVESGEIVEKRFKGQLVPWSNEPYSPTKHMIDEREIGEGNIYQITYKGLWGAKEIVSIELIQTREELVKKMAESNEMLFVGNEWTRDWLWGTLSSSGLPGDISSYRIIAVEKFNRRDAHITGRLYYDTTTVPHTLKAVCLTYYDNQGEIITRKVWMKVGKDWELKEDAREIRVVPQKDGSVEFELR